MEKIKKQKGYDIDMTSGPILKKMLLFSVPLMLSSILQLLFNAADIVVVGRFAGDNSLAAVGANTALINLLTNLFVGLSVGGNVVAAICMGAGRPDEVKKTVHTSMLLSIFSGLALTFIGIIGARRILILMQTPSEILDLAVTYLRIYFAGMIPLMIYNFGSALLRAAGDTRRPLVYLTASGVINVVLNLFFVIVFDMDVAGVALATVISETVSAVLIVRCLMKESAEKGMRLELKSLRIDGDKLKRIVRIGLPAGIQGVIFSLSNVVIQSSINSFGKTVVAGSSAASNIEGFVYVAMNSFHQSTLSFTSRNLGAGKPERIGKILRAGLVCVTLVGLVLGNGVVLFGETLLGIYSSEAGVIEAGMERLFIIACPYALLGIMDVIGGSLRGMGYSVTPTIISLVGVCGVRLLWLATVFTIPRFHNPQTIYLSYMISWLITIIAMAVLYVIASKRLKKIRTV